MILVVGLGNPGKKFEKTRHNIGFRVLDEFFQKNRDTSNFSSFRLEKKFRALISEGEFNRHKIILAKPQTFMNFSGKAIKLLIQKRLKKTMSELRRISDFLWIIHDDIDLPLGKIRIVKNRGAAGHKGVQSIIDELGTKDFVRFRIGIKPNSKFKIQNSKLQFKSQNFVLENFTKTEEKIIKKVIKKTVEAIEIAIKEGLEKAMNKYNQ